MAPRDDNTPLPESLRALAAELDDLGDALVQSASSTAPKAPAIDGFTVVEPLGRGGMGSVWRARQESLGRDVALKTISETLGQNPDGIARFLSESRTVARLSHPNIVTVHEAGRDGGLCWFAMELIDGRDAGHVSFPGPRALATFAAPLCDAIDFAHRHGILHRDIKPSNILVAADGMPKLGDFGLACLASAAPGDGAGTRRFMAPEILSGASPSEAGDIYSLGATLQHLAANNLGKASPDADFAAILAKAAAKDPLDRYLSAADFAADIRRYLAHRPVAARPASMPHRTALFIRRNPPAAIGIAVALVLLACVAALALRTHDPRPEPAPETPAREEARPRIRRRLMRQGRMPRPGRMPRAPY